MHIDMDEFRAVAEVVVRFNPYLKGSNPNDLVTKMVEHAHGFYNPGYCVVAGYMLTAFEHPEGGLGVKPSISHILFSSPSNTRKKK
jgi:hypothetical protein